MIKKKIIVTGSSKGIGYKIASNLEKDGHKVFLCRKSLKKKFIRGNFANPKDAFKTIHKGIKILNGLDVLICNIGQVNQSNLIELQEWVKMFNQNFSTQQMQLRAKKLN